MAEEFRTLASRSSSDEAEGYRALIAELRSGSIPDAEILANLHLFQERIAIGQTLFLAEMYEKIVGVPGSVAEFGVRWGRNLAAFTSLRSVFEPNNMSRRIVGFDTFTGFPGVSDEDGGASAVTQGGYSVSERWEDRLHALLAAHQKLAYRPNFDRFALVKGDVVETLPKFLLDNPHSIFSLVYLDLDLYAPTKFVLETLWDRVPKGGIVGFDEVNLAGFPGETIALLETIGISNHTFVQSKFSTTNFQAYLIKG